MSFLLLFFFSIGVCLGIVPAIIYGKLGGDETFEKEHPHLKDSLSVIHHYQMGLIIMGVSFLKFIRQPSENWDIFWLGFGLGMFLDDMLFHSYEAYFKRINGRKEK